MQVSTVDKAVYWIATAIVLALMGWSVVSYIYMYDFMSAYFTNMGYPTYIVYPLAALKLVAIIVIVSNRYNDLKEMAYGAYYINMVLATAAHLSIGDTPYHAYAGLVAVPVSYIYANRVRGRPDRSFFDIWPDAAQ